MSENEEFLTEEELAKCARYKACLTVEYTVILREGISATESVGEYNKEVGPSINRGLVHTDLKTKIDTAAQIFNGYAQYMEHASFVVWEEGKEN